jgi:phosphorylase kinase alpha/beta subunit
MNLINTLQQEMEKLLMPNGAFIAAPSNDYRACWLRDQIYCAISYYYLRNYPKLIKCFQVVFDILDKHSWKIDKAIAFPSMDKSDYIHAKYDPITFEEITNDWGHHQLDAIGLLLYFTAFFESQGIRILREKDKELIQVLVLYLFSHRYWEKPDNGMWEEESELHASSIGAVLAGLIYTSKKDIKPVPRFMIKQGWKALGTILPRESAKHEINMDQLSLIWPYNIVSRKMADIILERIKEKLVQEHGLNRYWGDKYYDSDYWICGQWPLGFFWLAIVEFQRRNIKEAKYWLKRGLEQIIDGKYIPELYKKGQPNEHTPLAWAHSFAIIALTLLN